MYLLNKNTVPGILNNVNSLTLKKLHNSKYDEVH